TKIGHLPRSLSSSFPAERGRGGPLAEERGVEREGRVLAARPFHHRLFASLGRRSPFPRTGKGNSAVLGRVRQAQDALGDDVRLNLLAAAEDRRGLAREPGPDRLALVLAERVAVPAQPLV